MEINNELIDSLEKEYSEEINLTKITVDDLKKAKISERSISREIYLRKIYGDEILVGSSGDNEIFGKRSITKLSDGDFGRRKEVASIFEKIEKSKFDEALDRLKIVR